MKILLIEEDTALCKFLTHALGREQYEVRVWNTANVIAGDGELILLDIGLPPREGMPVLRSIRKQSPAAFIVVLTIRDRTDDPAQYLDAGADDLVVKPFSFGELSARIRALRRRSRAFSPSILEVGDLKLDRVEHRVERAGRTIELTSREFCLLEYLMRNAGKRVSRGEIIQNVWKVALSPGGTNVVDVYIAYLRRKIDAKSIQKLIHTSRGVGYEISCGENLRPVNRALSADAQASDGR